LCLSMLTFAFGEPPPRASEEKIAWPFPLLGRTRIGVKRIVQYGFHLDRLLCVLIQRFGRAARMAGIKGGAIFLVESWAIGDRITSTRRGMFPNSQTLSTGSRNKS
jgi:hypothetical protein